MKPAGLILAVAVISLFHWVSAAQTQKKADVNQIYARCIASGRTEARCMAEVIAAGASSLTSMFDPKAPTTIEPGLKMAGAYPGAGDFSIANFGPTTAVVRCGGIGQFNPYEIERIGGKVIVNIMNGPAKVLSLEVMPDGRLNGRGQKITVVAPGPALQSSVFTPMPQSVTRTYTTLEASNPSNLPQGAQRNGQVYTTTTTASDGRSEASVGPGGTIVRTCTVGMLGPATEIDLGWLGEFAEQLGQTAKSNGLYAYPGFRMGGKYDFPGGLTVEFYPEAAVLECDEVLSGQPYTVERSGGKFLVTVKNGNSPLRLELDGAGKMTGAGDVEVNGRSVVGFVPDPQFGGKRPVLDRRVSTCAVDDKSKRAVAPTGPAQLTVTSGFAGKPGDPIAKRGIVLLRESFDTILRRAGDSISGWAFICRMASQSPDMAAACQRGVNMVVPHQSGIVLVDANGKASFATVPSGTYYVFTHGVYNGRHMIWNTRITLKPGANSIVLDAANALPVEQ